MKKIIASSIIIISFFVMNNASAQSQVFSDIYDQHINKDAIEYLKKNKIIEGYKDGSYKAENRINRAEFVKILVESQIQNPSGSFCFEDVKDEWFAPYVCTAKRLGYIKGYEDNTFKPSQNINFAEASKIITKVLNITPDEKDTKGEWYAGFINSLAKKKAIPSTIQFFDRNISRGEMAEIIWRIKEKKINKISQDYETLTQPLPKIKSCAALQEKFKTYNSYQYRERFLGRGAITIEDSVMEKSANNLPMAAKSISADSARGNEGSSDFSSTNIQVKGVDEADIIKNDGKYIYLIKKNTVRIIEAFPVNKMKEIAKIEFDDENFNPREMFLNDDQLVVIGQSWNNSTPSLNKRLIAPIRAGNSRTKVFMFDIKDQSVPKIQRKLSFEGDYRTSRRIDNQMLLILNQYPNYWTLDNVAKGQDLLPQYQEGDGSAKNLVGCDNIKYFPGYAVPNYLIVTNIPLDEPNGDLKTEVFLGASENVYSSTENLYVATNETNYNYYTDWNWEKDRINTLIFKFDISNGKVDYKSRGRVPGQILNQFSMDESNDYFRIATTSNQWSDKRSASQIYVLDDEMVIKGKIEDIAPGERIFSTRFIGDRLYMVTFKRVDPLFVISLKDPENPKILGKLKIPGFSDYLHPFDENYIIGFGKDTEENKNGALLTKGFKMALFDVSDVTNPKQKFSESIGDRGTDSELLRNHKALLFDKEKELLAFPINVIEKIDPNELECSKNRYDSCPGLCQKRCIPTSCTEDEEGRAVCTKDCGGLGSCTNPEYDRYNTTFSGAMVYELSKNKGFIQKGQITHFENQDIIKIGDYWPRDYQKNIQRILFIGNNLFTISESKVKANNIKTMEEVNEIKID